MTTYAAAAREAGKFLKVKTMPATALSVSLVTALEKKR